MKSKKPLIINTVIIGFVYLLVSILVESATWFQGSYDDSVSFATVVYQLSTPLQGTDQGIINAYCSRVIPATLRKVTCLVVFFYLFVRIFSVVDLRISLRLFRKNYTVILGKKFYYFGMVAMWLLVAAKSIIEIGNKVDELGIVEYIVDIRESSTIFEEYFADPKETDLVFPEEKRNLIFIFLESMETTYASVEAGGGKENNYIPELTALANEYISISNTDKVGGGYVCALTGWTMAGILGTTSGVPYKIPGEGNASGKYVDFLPGLTSLGDILEDEGYQNYFLCGSRGEFAGRDLYFQVHGNYEIRDYYYAVEQKYIPEGYWEFWGYEDEKLFDIAKKELTQLAESGANFNYTMLTVDTHFPDGYTCELCENKYDSQYANAIACSSKQVSEFVEWVQKQKWYDNTTIVLVGDHTSMANDFWDDIGDYERRTYNCFINLPDGVDTSNIKNRQFTTLDMFPTTLAALGVEIEGNRLALGVNLFSNEDTLMEKLGKEQLDQELSRYSKFYHNKLVKNE